MMVVVELVVVVVVGGGGAKKNFKHFPSIFFSHRLIGKRFTSQNIDQVIRYQAKKACYIE